MYKEIYKDEAFSCSLEIFEGRAFFHTDVTKPLRPSDVKRGRKAFTEICELVKGMGYNDLFALTPSPHFASLVGPGFTHIDTIVNNDTVMELIAWPMVQ